MSSTIRTTVISRPCVSRQYALVALLCVGLLFLGGCAGTGAAVVHHHYTLGVAAESPDNPGSSNQAKGGDGAVLRVASIAVPQWLAGTAMYYRLAYRDGSRLAAYVYSDWAEPPAKLLVAMIRSTLAESGQWQAVVGPGNPAVADVTLHLRLGRFAQVYMQSDQSVGVIEAAATLVDNGSGKVLAQRDFRLRVPAASPDAQAGAQALGQASRKLAAKLQEWVREVHPSR